MPSLLRTLRSSPIFLTLLAASCGLPRDPGKTSERIASTHELRVGVSDNPPWTVVSRAEPQGIEPELVRDIARRMGAHVQWHPGSETRLIEDLEAHKLDLVIGGFDKKTQWSTKAGITQPFLKDPGGKQRVFLAGPGENGFILSLDKLLIEHRP